MNDYYGHHPIRVPRIPISLIGFMGSMPDVVGYRVAQFTGLGFVDVNRAIEHQAGRSLARLAADRGEDAVRTLEISCTRTALRARPSTIIALGDAVVDDNETMEMIARESALVYLRMDVATLHRRILDRRRLVASAFFPWIPLDEPVLLDQVAAMVASREQAFESAMLRVEATARSVDDLAAEIMHSFELLDARG